jgi:TIR domain
MSSVFIGHASANHDLVGRVFLGLLKALGFDTWYAPEDIRSSEVWKHSIVSGLQDADWFVLVVSDQAASSDWVKAEVDWAFQNLPDRIIPIRIDGCDPLDIDKRLLGIHYIDYKADTIRATQRLVKLLVDAEYGGFRRQLAGSWLSAVQPVYYAAGDAWHIQEVQIVPTPRGYAVVTVRVEGKLQWRLDAKLVANSFLVGRWFSRREGSHSHGYMSLQISRNGMYMFGHDYGIVFEEGKAHFGVLLLAKDKEHLEKARAAMKSARRELLPLDQTMDFPGT